jgi:hypothetical protein
MAAKMAMGDILPTVVWPSDVDAKKREIDPSMQATNAVVTTCGGVTAEERLAWSQFFGAWTAFRNEATPTFGAANKYDEAKRFAVSLLAWRATIQNRCALVGPDPPQDATTPETAISAIKWIAIAVVAAAVTYGAVQVVGTVRAVAR